MPEHNSDEEVLVPRLEPTERLVERAARRLRDARHGGTTSLATALRLGWRGERLLARFDCRHRGVVATLREDNADLWTEDVVEAFIALEEPPARYLELEVNPLGARYSAIVDSPNLRREGMTVEKIELPDFRAEVRTREERWSALLSIPVGRTGAARDPWTRSLRAVVMEEPSVSERDSGSSAVTGPVRPARIFRANFFRIDRTSGEFAALFPTLADPPDFHVPRCFGWLRLA